MRAYGEHVCALYASCACGAAPVEVCQERVTDDAARFLAANESARKAYREDCKADLLAAIDRWSCAGGPAGDLDALLRTACPPKAGEGGGSGVLGAGEATTSTWRAQLADGQECRADEACFSGACVEGHCGGGDSTGAPGQGNAQGVCGYADQVFRSPQACSDDDWCDDFNPCSEDRCVEGTCRFSATCHGFGECVEDWRGARSCLCDPGHVEGYCSQCAETHEKEADGRCTPAPDPARFMLISTTEGDGPGARHGLAAVDAKGKVYPLVSTELPLSALTLKRATGQIFALSPSHPGSIVEVDLKTGALSSVASFDGYHSVYGLAHNADDDVLYANATIGASNYILNYSFSDERVGRINDGAPTATGIAYDAGQQRYVGVSASSTAQCMSWAPHTTHASLAALPNGLNAPDLTYRDGTLYMAANRRLSREEWAATYCHMAAKALGVDTEGMAEAVMYENNPRDAGPLSIKSESNGPHVWSYGSYGDRSDPPRAVTVETSDPGDVICIGTYEEQMTITIAAGAKFRLLVVGSFEPGPTIVFEDGFEYAGSQAPIHHGSRSSEPPPPPATHAELVRGYTGSDWTSAGLPSPSFDGSLRRISVIGTLDIDTCAYDFVEMDAAHFAGGLTSLR